MAQIGLFVREDDYSSWEFLGFFPTSKQAVMRFNLVEIEHENAEGIWFDPDEVLNSLISDDDDHEYED